jgi:hypothetical protein
MRRGINIGSASALSSCSTRMTCPIRHGGCGLYREHEPSAVPNIFFRWDTFRTSAPLMPKKNLRDGPRRPPRRHRRLLLGKFLQNEEREKRLLERRRRASRSRMILATNSPTYRPRGAKHGREEFFGELTCKSHIQSERCRQGNRGGAGCHATETAETRVIILRKLRVSEKLVDDSV